MPLMLFREKQLKYLLSNVWSPCHLLSKSNLYMVTCISIFDIYISTNTGSYPLFLDIISYPDPRSQSGYISRSYIQIWHRIYIISRSISISLFSVNFCFKKYLSFQLYTSSNLVITKSMAVD